MAERHYTATPVDFDGETFTVEGLTQALAAINEKFGGKPFDTKRVSPALSLGNGATIVATEAGRLMLVRDDAAKAQAEMREAAERLPDGRLRQFKAEVHIGRYVSHNKLEETAVKTVIGAGLMGVLFEAAMFVQETLGDVPDCMSYEACERRERSMRAQLSRANTQDKEHTTVHFPSSERGSQFELSTRLNEFYRVSVVIYTAEPQADPGAPRRQR